MKRQRSSSVSASLLTLCLALFMTAACIPRVSSLESQIASAEDKWKAQSISSYRITVMHVQSIWHAQSYITTVRDNKIVDQQTTCTPAPIEGGKCDVKPFKPEDYTVPGLFATARAQAEGKRGQWAKVAFDATYGYPKIISRDNPDAYDDDESWSVKAFEVLK